MDRPFTEKDNGKSFKTKVDHPNHIIKLQKITGKLEYPLIDPSEPTKFGILWLDEPAEYVVEGPRIDTVHWFYVCPEDVEEIK